MHREIITISISVDQSVSGIIILPDDAVAILVLAHGAGADMHHLFMENLSSALAEHHVATLRFNFLYTELNKRLPDYPALATRIVKAAIIETHQRYPKLPLFAGGKSFGGRMTSQLIAKECPDFLKGIVFFGFPLHPPEKPSIERAAHLENIELPMLFLQGTKDKLATLELIQQVCTTLPTATLQLFEKADHAFKQSKVDLIPSLALFSAEWMAKQIVL